MKMIWEKAVKEDLMYDEDVSYTDGSWSWVMVNVGLFVFFLILTAWLGNVSAHDIPSKVPREARERKNPLAQNEVLTAAGKELYAKLCLSCHGPSGRGDGPAAAALSHRPTDFASVLPGQMDGELFYKITKGGGAMPSYEKTLTEEERWRIILFLRTLESTGEGRGR